MKILMKTILLLGVLYHFGFSQPISIAILNFENKGSDSTNVHSFTLSNQFQDILYSSTNINIVERLRIEQVLTELGLGESGIFENSTVTKVGQMVGAEKIVLGEYQFESNEKVNINTRLVNVERGLLEGQWIIEGTKESTINDYCKNVSNEIVKIINHQVSLRNLASLQNPNATFDVSIITEKNEYQIGEFLNIQVTSSVDCYIHLFDVGTSGNIHLLYPNEIQKNKKLNCNEELVINNLRVDPPVGNELVKVIATIDSISIEDMLKIANTPATFELVSANTDSFAKDLSLVVSPLPDDVWSTSSSVIFIVNN